MYILYTNLCRYNINIYGNTAHDPLARAKLVAMDNGIYVYIYTNLIWYVCTLHTRMHTWHIQGARLCAQGLLISWKHQAISICTTSKEPVIRAKQVVILNTFLWNWDHHFLEIPLKFHHGIWIFKNTIANLSQAHSWMVPAIWLRPDGPGGITGHGNIDPLSARWVAP